MTLGILVSGNRYYYYGTFKSGYEAYMIAKYYKKEVGARFFIKKKENRYLLYLTKKRIWEQAD